jgi:hypothetical protein
MVQIGGPWKWNVALESAENVPPNGVGVRSRLRTGRVEEEKSCPAS